MANVSDSFNRADDATSLGTADSGQAWTAELGTWGISSNQAYLVTSAGDAQNTAWVETSETDGTAQVTIAVVGGSNVGIVFRLVDGNNYYIAIHDGGVLYFYRRLAGGFTLLGNLSYTLVAGDVFSVVMAGSDFDFKVNAVSKITVNDSNHTGTKCGIRHGGAASAARFDDFTFTGVSVPIYPSFRVNKLRPGFFKPGLAR